MSKKVADACAAAEGAFDAYRGRGLEERANFLEAIGDEIVALGDQLIETASRETALPKARLEGERARTVGQLRMFAEFVRSAEWLRCRVEPAQPDREPTPRPELRMRMLPLGPVAVFGASNFPLAFSTAGGDTAAALAAGCPVVLKSHSAHQETSGLVGSAVERAAERTGMPAGVFTHLSAGGHGIGRALVQDPRDSPGRGQVASLYSNWRRLGRFRSPSMPRCRASTPLFCFRMRCAREVRNWVGQARTRSPLAADNFVRTRAYCWLSEATVSEIFSPRQGKV